LNLKMKNLNLKNSINNLNKNSITLLKNKIIIINISINNLRITSINNSLTTLHSSSSSSTCNNNLLTSSQCISSHRTLVGTRTLVGRVHRISLKRILTLPIALSSRTYLILVNLEMNHCVRFQNRNLILKSQKFKKYQNKNQKFKKK